MTAFISWPHPDYFFLLWFDISLFLRLHLPISFPRIVSAIFHLRICWFFANHRIACNISSFCICYRISRLWVISLFSGFWFYTKFETTLRRLICLAIPNTIQLAAHISHTCFGRVRFRLHCNRFLRRVIFRQCFWGSLDSNSSIIFTMSSHFSSKFFFNLMFFQRHSSLYCNAIGF